MVLEELEGKLYSMGLVIIINVLCMYVVYAANLFPNIFTPCFINVNNYVLLYVRCLNDIEMTCFSPTMIT